MWVSEGEERVREEVEERLKRDALFTPLKMPSPAAPRSGTLLHSALSASSGDALFCPWYNVRRIINC